MARTRIDAETLCAVLAHILVKLYVALFIILDGVARNLLFNFHGAHVAPSAGKGIRDSRTRKRVPGEPCSLDRFPWFARGNLFLSLLLLCDSFLSTLTSTSFRLISSQFPQGQEVLHPFPIQDIASRHLPGALVKA